MLTTTRIPFRVRFARARPALGYRRVFVCLSGAPNENIVQNYINIALLNVFIFSI